MAWVQCRECKEKFEMPVNQIRSFKNNICMVKGFYYCPKCKKAQEFFDSIINPNSDQNQIECPKCSSTQIMANQKGFSAGKALGGALVTGGIGLLAGFHGSKKIEIACLNCSYKWKLGE